MSATNECVTRDAAGGFTQTSKRLQIYSVVGEKLIVNREIAACGLLVAEDGSLLAVSTTGEMMHYSLAEIVKHFFADPMWKFRCRRVFYLHSIFER